MAEARLIITGINPEPYALGTTSAGRRGGRIKSSMSPNMKMQTYQNALRDEIATRDFTGFPTGHVAIRFMFWRELEIGHTNTGKATRGEEADTTNLQKATEDAIQGSLLTNDRQVRDIHSTLVMQDEQIVPAIWIEVYPWTFSQAYQNLTFDVIRHHQVVRQSANSWG